MQRVSAAVRMSLSAAVLGMLGANHGSGRAHARNLIRSYRAEARINKHNGKSRFTKSPLRLSKRRAANKVARLSRKVNRQIAQGKR